MLEKRDIFYYINIILIICLVLLILSIIVLSLVPPVSKDALTHHLAVPKLYIKHGGIYEIPFMEYSYYPMNLDLLYIIPLYFGSDIIPKFIHFAFALLNYLAHFLLSKKEDEFSLCDLWCGLFPFYSRYSKAIYHGLY